MKIYVASSWKNPYHDRVINELKNTGHDVYDYRENEGFNWGMVDPKWETWNREQQIEAYRHPLAEKGFKSDADALSWADVVVAVAPLGVSSAIEAGWMKGAGKPVILFYPEGVNPRGDLMTKYFIHVLSIPDMHITLAHLKRISCNFQQSMS